MLLRIHIKLLYLGNWLVFLNKHILPLLKNKNKPSKTIPMHPYTLTNIAATTYSIRVTFDKL